MCVCIYVCLSVCLFECVCVYLSVCLSMCVHVCMSVCMCVCLTVLDVMYICALHCMVYGTGPNAWLLCCLLWSMDTAKPML